MAIAMILDFLEESRFEDIVVLDFCGLTRIEDGLDLLTFQKDPGLFLAYGCKAQETSYSLTCIMSTLFCYIV